MVKQYYIYKFLDKKNDILYIGRTNDIYRRILKEHFTDLGHLPYECYKSIEKVVYTEIKFESEEVAYEAILINLLKPKYNIQFKDEGNFNTFIPEFKWLDFKWEYEGQLQYLKFLKDSTIKAINYGIGAFENISNKKYITGYVDIDQNVFIHDTSFMLVSGDVSSGKTAYALNIAVYLSTVNNKKILYMNLKEDGENLSYRTLSNMATVDTKRITNGYLDDKDLSKVQNSLSQLQKSNLFLCNLSSNDKEIDRIIQVIKKEPYDFIIIDDYHSICCRENSFEKDKSINIMRKLKYLSNDIRTPIMLIVQIPSNTVITRVDHRPILYDLEFDSMRSFPDIIQFLYYDEKYSSDIEKTNRIEVITAKNNLGKVFSTELAFLKEYSRLSNIDKCSR